MMVLGTMMWVYIGGLFTGATLALPLGAWLGHRVYRFGGTIRPRLVPVIDRRITVRERDHGLADRRNGNGNGVHPVSVEPEPELQQGHG